MESTKLKSTIHIDRPKNISCCSNLHLLIVNLFNDCFYWSNQFHKRLHSIRPTILSFNDTLNEEYTERVYRLNNTM